MSVPEPKQDGTRRYGEWGGNPKGTKEDPERCIEEIWPTIGWIPHQCNRKRGHGSNSLFCKQHAKMDAKRKPHPKTDM